jgi:hypothetical protein
LDCNTALDCRIIDDGDVGDDDDNNGDDDRDGDSGDDLVSGDDCGREVDDACSLGFDDDDLLEIFIADGNSDEAAAGISDDIDDDCGRDIDDKGLDFGDRGELDDDGRMVDDKGVVVKVVLVLIVKKLSFAVDIVNSSSYN